MQNSTAVHKTTATQAHTHQDFQHRLGRHRNEHIQSELLKRNITIEEIELPQAGDNIRIGPKYKNNKLELVICASKKAHKIEIAIYDSQNDTVPALVIPFADNQKMSCSDHNKLFLKLSGDGVKPGMSYHIVVDGRMAVDPKCTALAGTHQWIHPENFPYDKEHSAPCRQDYSSLENLELGKASSEPFILPKSVVLPEQERVPEGEHVVIPHHQKVIYEFHPKSTQRNLMIPEADRGLLKSIASDEMIKHFKSLRITSVKFPPLHYAIDEAFLVQSGKENAWGYNTAHFFGLNPKYFKSKDPQGMIDELRAIIKTLHENGIECIYDSVVAHNSEHSPGRGPATSLRVMGEELYFRTDKKGRHYNWSGCGNTIDSNTELSQDLIIGSAYFYRNVLGFDSMRIDQANILMRGKNHSPEIDPTHPIMSKLSQLYGPMQILNETCDLYSDKASERGSPTITYGQYPEDVIEITFRSRDINRKAFCPELDRYDDKPLYDHNGNRVSLEAMLAYASSDNSDIYGDTGRKNDLSFMACHDGPRPITLATQAEKENWKKMKGSLTVPEIRERILARTRAMEASATIFVPGAIKISMGSEVLRSQRHQYNPWDNPELLVYQTSPNSRHHASHLEFFKKAMSLRKEFSHFYERAHKFSQDEMAWYDRDGKPVRDWDNLDGFLGQMFNQNGNNLSEGALYAVRALKACKMTLPEAPAGMQWVRRMDTQLKDVQDQFEKAELYSEYVFNQEAVALFELKKMYH